MKRQRVVINIMGVGKVYLQPMEMLYDTMLDLMELQNGKEMINDPVRGKLHFTISMYGFKWELRFTALDIDKNRCGVYLDIGEAVNEGGEAGQDYIETMVRREYAMLDSLLLIGTQFELKLRK